MPEPAVMISIPHQGQVAAGLLHFIATSMGCGNVYGLVTPEKKPFAVARNHQVQEFLKTPATHCLFIDADVVPPPGTISRLLEHDQDIVGLPVPAAGDGGTAWPVALMDAGFDDDRLTRQHEVPYDRIRSGGLIDVDGYGLACCLIRREVFEALEPPWFVDQLNELGGLRQEADLWFCERARVAGFQPRLSCIGGMQAPVCGHLKLCDVSKPLRAWGSLDAEAHRAVIHKYRQTQLAALKAASAAPKEAV